MTIPALWAGKTAEGEDVGGVEPAEVMVLEHRDGVDPVDLTRIDSSGAGPQWLAATSQAAVTYNESINGDLSNSSGSPTVLTSGTYPINGTLDFLADPSDHFIFSELYGDDFSCLMDETLFL